MQSVQEIYDSTVSHLPTSAQMQLVSLIIEKLAEVGHQAQAHPERRAVLDLLEEWQGQRLFKTSAEADAYLREERDSWER